MIMLVGNEYKVRYSNKFVKLLEEKVFMKSNIGTYTIIHWNRENVNDLKLDLPEIVSKSVFLQFPILYSKLR